MKRSLGISLYPDHSDPQKDREYIETAHQYGFSRIFMSMLEISEDPEVVQKKFQQLIFFAKERGFETILDVSPAIFEQLNISYDDLGFFHKLGADGIRLDLGFDGKKEALLTFNPYQFAIELNMSNDVAYLENILTHQANTSFLYGCHNFYPQEGTGLPYHFFQSSSERFKKNGIRTAAFITSQSGRIGPWDINDGLPTLEMHRHFSVETAAKHLFATNLIDDIIIGNAYASEEELKSLGHLDRYQTVFRVEFVANINEVERQIVLEEQHVRRGDITDQVIRSTEVRKKYQKYENKAHDTEFEFVVGDVVVGNDRFGKYKNELQIVLEPHSDPRKNKVGHIIQEELILLPFIHPWSKFKFIEK